MTLCDAGPLVALIDAADAHHGKCSSALKKIPSSGLLTTWPCLAEAMHLLGRGTGWRGQDQLWGYIADGFVQLHEPANDEWIRMRQLMDRYADTPMDLADASLVAASESLKQRRVFTVDRHFHIYRQQQGQAFEVVP